MVLPFDDMEGEYVPAYAYDEDVDPNILPGEQEQFGDYRKLAGDLTQPSVLCFLFY
jgi:hypothetical protein